MKIIRKYFKEENKFCYIAKEMFAMPIWVLVDGLAPEEAHNEAKRQLTKAFESRTIKSKLKRQRQKIGFWLINK